MHVIVIGAGITGLSTAWTLWQAGMQVSVIEQAAAPAQGASAQNGAQLSYAYVAPMASWATLKSVPQLLWDPASPLRFKPGLSWPLWAWCLQFVRACHAAEAERSTRALLDLGALSRECFESWRRAQPHNTIDHAENGKLVLLRDAASWQSARAQVALQAPWGPSQLLLTAQECLEQEPALAAREEPLMGGVLTPSEQVADCALVCAQLARELQTRARWHWQTEAVAWELQRGRVLGLRVRGGSNGQPERRIVADAYVVANGVNAPALLAPLGLRLPIAALKGYSIELPAHSLQGMPRLSITDSARKIVFAPLGEGPQRRLRVAGMAELVGGDLRIDPQRIHQLLRATEQLFGLSQAPADVRPWAGQRPTTPTGRPCIGQLRQAPNVFVNAGQGALGFTLAFGSARVLAQLLQGEASPLRDPAAFKHGLMP